jgi:hypothetical protein
MFNDLKNLKMMKIPKPKNSTINERLCIPYYSNSKFLYKKRKKNYSKTNISSNLYNNIPKNITLKKVPRPNCITPIRYLGLDAYEKAEIESAINNQIKSKKYQNILLKDKEIKNYLHLEKKEIKKDIAQQKMKLKEDLTKIIKDSISLAKNTYKTTNLSVDSRDVKKSSSKQKNIDFLNSIGISIEPTNNRNNNINVNIDKTWNYVNKISKGKNNIDDILRYKIVHNLMVITGKKRKNILNRSNSKNSKSNNINNSSNNYIKINQKRKVNNNNKSTNKNKIKMNPMNRSINIPFSNNRHRMIEIINRSYNLTTNADDKNELQQISKTEF